MGMARARVVRRGWFRLAAAFATMCLRGAELRRPFMQNVSARASNSSSPTWVVSTTSRLISPVSAARRPSPVVQTDNMSWFRPRVARWKSPRTTSVPRAVRHSQRVSHNRGATPSAPPRRRLPLVRFFVLDDLPDASPWKEATCWDSIAAPSVGLREELSTISPSATAPRWPACRHVGIARRRRECEACWCCPAERCASSTVR
jgi:hypothetical protein